MLLGAIPRISRIHQPLHMDEGAAIHDFLREPLGRTFTHFNAGVNHPLYNLLAHATSWARLEPWTIRLPALVAGIAAAPVLFLLLRPHTGAVPACLAAAALALARHQIEFSVFARGYSLAVLCTTIANGMLVGAIQSDRRSNWFGYVIAMVAAVYSHLWCLIVLAGQAMFVVLVSRRIGSRAVLRFACALLAACSAITVLYAAMVPDILRMLHDHTQLPFAPRFWHAIRDNSILGQPWIGIGQWTVAVHVFMLGGTALALWRPRLQISLAATLHATIVVVGLAVVVAVRPAVFFPRYLFFLFPSYASVFAMALSAVLTGRDRNGGWRHGYLAHILGLGGSIAAVVLPATAWLCPNAPLAWSWVVQVPQVAISALLLMCLLEPLSGWKRQVTVAGLTAAGVYCAAVLTIELSEAPLDRLLTAVVAIPLGLLVILELRHTRGLSGERLSLNREKPFGQP